MDKPLRMAAIQKLIEIGISFAKISDLVGISLGTVWNDTHALEKSGELASGRCRVDNVFGNALVAYDFFQRRNHHGFPSEFESFMFEVLQRYLNMADFHVYLGGLEATREKLLIPEHPDNLQPYVDFVAAVFFDQREAIYTNARYCFDGPYLEEISTKKRPAPKSFPALKADFAEWFLKSYRAKIVPVWPPYVSFVIDKILEEAFDEEGRHIIRCHFGIGSKKKTLGKIGQDIGIAGTSVKARLIKHLGRVRRDALRYKAIHLLWGRGDILAAALAEDMPNQTEVMACELGIVDDQEVDTASEEAPSTDNLFLSIRELGLSSRTINILIQADIQLIGELVEWYDHKLLKIRNAGRKSLNEIKNVLADLGLCLGMKLPENIRKLVQEERRRKHPKE